MSDVGRRLQALVQQWNVTVEYTKETDSSILGFGTRRDQPVVLKLVKSEGDEWHSGEVLAAFQGRGVVRMYEYVEGAVLLERAIPGESLVNVVTDGHDDDAT